MVVSALSGVKPNWPMMKAGLLFILMARCSEKATSSAVTFAPLEKVASSPITKVKTLLSASASQDFAMTGSTLVESSRFARTSFWYMLDMISPPTASKPSCGSRLVMLSSCCATTRISLGVAANAGMCA
ncbi:hypothetical protein D3C80_1673320 [compost metagenome]